MMSKLRLFVLVVCIQIVVVGAIYGISEASQPTPPDPETTKAEPREPVSKSLSSPGEEIELTEASAPDAVNIFYRIAGATFVPRDSDTEYEYGGAGCMYRSDNVGDSFFLAEIQIPDGAIIDFLRVYYYDDSADHNVGAELYSYDGEGGYTLITDVAGSGTPGYDSAGSGFFSHEVDNIKEALVVFASLDGSSDNTLRLCGVRLRYQCSPPSCTYLPACFR